MKTRTDYRQGRVGVLVTVPSPMGLCFAENTKCNQSRRPFGYLTTSFKLGFLSSHNVMASGTRAMRGRLASIEFTGTREYEYEMAKNNYWVALWYIKAMC